MTCSCSTRPAWSGHRTWRGSSPRCERAGAKLVVVGDPEQLQPIAAGAPFRAIADTVGHVTLSDIRRQADPAMRAATKAFARGDMAAGLRPYLAAGAVRTVETTDDAIGDMVEAYVAGMDRAGTQIALAYRNADVRRLNMNIRALLRDTDRLGVDAVYRARDGELAFAAERPRAVPGDGQGRGRAGRQRRARDGRERRRGMR